MKAARVELVKHNTEGLEILRGEPCPLACQAEDCSRDCPGPGVKLLIDEEKLTREGLMQVMDLVTCSPTPSASI